jgi:phasin
MLAPNRFYVPPEMQAFAEKSVEQTRQAFNSFAAAAYHAGQALEGQAENARKGTKDVTEKVLTFAEQNIASSFQLAQQLVRARDFQDMLKLQAGWIRQLQVFAEQARELGESASDAARSVYAEKPKARM